MKIEYKETAEYAFDVMEHELQNVKLIIEKVGADKFVVLVPTKFKYNLQTMSKNYITNTTEVSYPTKYRGMDIVFTNVGNVMFALKGDNA